jgi:hypothetical protein
MKPGYDVAARKRPVNLTLNEDLVQQAKGSVVLHPLEIVSIPRVVAWVGCSDQAQQRASGGAQVSMRVARRLASSNR